MQFKCAMCLATMEKYSDACNRDMGNHHCKDEDLPSACACKSIREKINYRFKKSAQNNMYSVVNSIIAVIFQEKLTTIFVYFTEYFTRFSNEGLKLCQRHYSR